ncbi:MAG: hypothetical protein ABWZ77_00365 [Naasia sp.]
MTRAAMVTGMLCGIVVVPLGSLSAAAATGCDTTDAGITAAASSAGGGLPEALAAVFSDGVLTGTEVAASGYAVACGDGGAVTFVLSSETPPAPAPSPDPSVTAAPPVAETPASTAPPAAEAPPAVAQKAPTATRSTRPSTASAATAAPSAAAASPAPVAAPAAPAPSEAPSAAASDASDDDAELETLAERGASAQDERVAAEALGSTSLSSSRGQLPGIGVIAGISGAAALALGGVAALIGRTGDRRPRHSR